MGHGSHLVKIETKAENDYLTDLHLDHESWIGANDIGTEGLFRWLDGSKIGFSNWKRGEPNNNGNEDCVHLGNYGHGLWNDDQCWNHKYFFCEREMTA